MEALKKYTFIILISIFGWLNAQTYSISIFGIPAVEVEMSLEDNHITFITESVGLIDYFWPTNNEYSTEFDQKTFGILSFEKKVKQGSTNYSQSAVYDTTQNIFIYDELKLERPPEIQSIFTMLVRVQKENVEDLDTKWFPLDHQGVLYSTRLLWADTSSITIAGSTILCDHYRLDIKPEEDVTSLPEQSDYFMNNIIDPGAVRQLWVEKEGRRRIIKAAVKIYGLNIIATIQHV